MRKIAKPFASRLVVHRALPQALRAALGLAALGTAGVSTAATITVDTTLDETITNGKCSLREAIANANSNTAGAADCAAGSGADTIVFAPGIFPPGTLTASLVTMGLLALTDTNPTTIDGGGVVAIDGGDSSALFKTAAGTTTHFVSLTLRHGTYIEGGAINNGGTATVDRSTLSGNYGPAKGGAIYTSGPLTIMNSTISGNKTSVPNGAGGGVYCYVCTSLSIVNSTITGNTSAHGGGIFKRYAQLALTNVTLAANTATTDGPQLFVQDILPDTVDLVNTIVSGSPATNCHFNAPGSNASVNDHGKNIDDGSTCFAPPAPGFSYQNTNPQLSSLADYGGPTLTMMPSLSSKAVDSGSCADAPSTDQRGVVRPQGPGCDIGAVELTGSTITVDTAADVAAADGKCSLREALYNASYNSAHYSDCGAGVADDTIVFDPAVFPSGQLTTISVSAPLQISAPVIDRGPLTIDGGGTVAIDGGGVHQIFVTGSDVKLKGLTLRNGHSAIVNGGSLVVEQCTISGNSGLNGGAISNSGGLLVKDSTLSANTTTASGLGGAIYSSNGFSVSLQNSTISGNAAFKGGGLFVASPGGQIDNSTIANNSAVTGVAIYFGNGSFGSFESVRDSIITGAGGGSTCATSSLQVPTTDLGGNVEDGNSCGFAASNGSKPITNPLLGPLRWNGGPTQTLRPLRGSPAIDATSCQYSTDQRGVARPQGVECDSGAVESDDIFEHYLDPPNTCLLGADCPAAADPQCTYNVCTAGACSEAFATIGAFCTGGQCDGMGTCLHN